MLLLTGAITLTLHLPLTLTLTAIARVGDAVESVINWIEEAWNAAWEALEKFANALMSALSAFWDALLAGLNAIWELIKKIGMAIYNAIMAFLKWIWEQLKKFFLKFMDLLPKFDYLMFQDVYIRCLTDPKNCDKDTAKKVKLSMCFTSLGVTLISDLPFTPTQP